MTSKKFWKNLLTLNWRTRTLIVTKSTRLMVKIYHWRAFGRELQGFECHRNSEKPPKQPRELPLRRIYFVSELSIYNARALWYTLAKFTSIGMTWIIGLILSSKGIWELWWNK